MPVVPTEAMPLTVFRNEMPRSNMEARRAGCAVRKDGVTWTSIAYRTRAGVHIPHRAGTEVQEEGPVRRDEEGDRRDTEGAGRANGRGGDARGRCLPGPHPHLPEDGPEARRERRRREAEGRGRDHPARAAPGVAKGRGQGPDAVGGGAAA